MFHRSLLILCVLACYIVFSSAQSSSGDHPHDLSPAFPDNSVTRANAAGIVAKLIANLFAGAAASCLGQAANACKDNWKHVHAARDCAKNYLKNNKGRCAAGK